MSAKNSNSVLPPGILISSSFSNLESQISFLRPRPTTPLQPLSQANDNDGLLQVSNVVFIDSSIKIDAFDVYYDDSGVMPTFYIVYEGPETQASEFNAYQINFELRVDPMPYEIQTVLWDKDPTTSRGTIVIVAN